MVVSSLGWVLEHCPLIAPVELSAGSFGSGSNFHE
jgi:hypothetical protein